MSHWLYFSEVRLHSSFIHSLEHDISTDNKTSTFFFLVLSNLISTAELHSAHWCSHSGNDSSFNSYSSKNNPRYDNTNTQKQKCTSMPLYWGKPVRLWFQHNRTSQNYWGQWGDSWAIGGAGAGKHTHTQALEKTCDPGLELGKLRGLEGIKSYTLSLSLSHTHTHLYSEFKQAWAHGQVYPRTHTREVCVTQFIIGGC